MEGRALEWTDAAGRSDDVRRLSAAKVQLTRAQKTTADPEPELEEVGFLQKWIDVSKNGRLIFTLGGKKLPISSSV